MKLIEAVNTKGMRGTWHRWELGDPMPAEGALVRPMKGCGVLGGVGHVVRVETPDWTDTDDSFSIKNHGGFYVITTTSAHGVWLSYLEVFTEDTKPLPKFMEMECRHRDERGCLVPEDQGLRRCRLLAPGQAGAAVKNKIKKKTTRCYGCSGQGTISGGNGFWNTCKVCKGRKVV